MEAHKSFVQGIEEVTSNHGCLWIFQPKWEWDCNCIRIYFALCYCWPFESPVVESSALSLDLLHVHVQTTQLKTTLTSFTSFFELYFCLALRAIDCFRVQYFFYLICHELIHLINHVESCSCSEYIRKRWRRAIENHKVRLQICTLLFAAFSKLSFK